MGLFNASQPTVVRRGNCYKQFFRYKGRGLGWYEVRIGGISDSNLILIIETCKIEPQTVKNAKPTRV